MYEFKLPLQNNSYGYMYNFILLMISTGIRPGELIALEWNDINIENKTINIDKTIINGKVGNVKTVSSIRTVDILPNAEKALKQQAVITSNYSNVFINSSFKIFYSHDIINLNLKKILLKANVKIRKLYNLRHTFASQMISKGIDITWVSQMLGHKDVSITLKTYTKFIKEEDTERLNKLDSIINLL